MAYADTYIGVYHNSASQDLVYSVMARSTILRYQRLRPNLYAVCAKAKNIQSMSDFWLGWDMIRKGSLKYHMHKRCTRPCVQTVQTRSHSKRCFRHLKTKMKRQKHGIEDQELW